MVSAKQLASSLAAEARQAIDELVVDHGLTDRFTVVWGNAGDTICTRMEARGHLLAPEDVSRACGRLAKAGRAEKRPHGYRLPPEVTCTACGCFVRVLPGGACTECAVVMEAAR